MRFGVIVTVGFLLVTARVFAQPTLPPRWDDLPKQAATWPPAWAALVAELKPGTSDFEKTVMQRVDSLVRAEKLTKDTYGLADIVLAAMLRHHLSVRRPPPLADNPDQALQGELEDRLASVRKDWLEYLQKTGDHAGAMSLAERWLPTATAGPVRSAIQSLWTEQAKTAISKSDYPAARTWLNRLEANFTDAPAIEEIRMPLRERAQGLFKQSQAMQDAEAIRALEEALAIWPRLPEARDALDRRRGTYKTLVVAVRSLPEHLSPATAATEVERQSLELLFDRLLEIEYSPGLGRRYRPRLVATLPTGFPTAALPLRRDAYWSTGERVTAADLRHSALLTNHAEAAGRSGLWRDFLEIPRVEADAFLLKLGYRQGLFDPLAPLTFWVLPQYYRGKQLQRGDDPDFAKAPLGSGPFQYVGRKTEAGKTFAVFRTNPHDLRGGVHPLREIRMLTWADARKDFPPPAERPHLILDAPTDQLVAFKAFGYVEAEPKSAPTASFLAVNHRKPSLASVSVRRAIAHGLDRQGLLDRHFRTEAGKRHASANGIFPRESWANAPAPRVPAELYHADQARSFARKVKKEAAAVAWTLKYPAGEPHVKAAFDEMAQSIAALFQEAGIKAEVQPQGLQPHALLKAIRERDFDLVYTSADRLDDPVNLALFFDRQEDATRAGGTNDLGYDNDAKLHELLREALQHRRFAAVQESMQSIHVHLYETMPLIPLWYLETHVLVHPSLRTPGLDPQAVFANVRQWKIDK